MPRVLRALQFLRPKAVPPPPPSSSSISAFLAALRAHTPKVLRAAFEEFLRGKSQAEILFLVAILLSVALFTVILPLCEALFGYDGDESTEDESEKEVKLRIYQPGVGVVEVDAGSLPETYLKRLSSGGSTNSSRSCGSLDTIEESEEEYLNEEEDEEEDDSIEANSIEAESSSDPLPAYPFPRSRPVHSADDERQEPPSRFPKEESAAGFLRFLASASKAQSGDPMPDLDASQDLSIDSEDEDGGNPFEDLLARRYKAYEAARDEARMGLSLDHMPREVAA
ncbi:hypothetical protein ACHAXT_007284 [Thalassiosira profunda]